MKVAVFKHNAELTDEYLRRMAALGADCLDFTADKEMPGVERQGYPDLDELRAMRKRIRSFGLDINRVTLPNLGSKFINDEPGGEEELENTCRALRIYGEAKIPIARQRLAGDVFPQLMTRYQATHRGGYLTRGESMGFTEGEPVVPDKATLDRWWERFVYAFERMVPIAEDYDIKLAVHPSDTPNADTPLGSLGFHRVIDAFPSPNVGYVYCIGTRAEAGGSSLVMDEINLYGRKGKIFMVHMRNVRGSLATAGAFEEVLLDDGDLNMFKILRELQRVGFTGAINPDHIPTLPGDTSIKTAGWAYSIGYVRALLAALAA